MFADLITILEEKGRGLNAFQKCAETARTRAAEGTEQAAAWALMSVIASEFVDANERMAISTSQINWQIEQYVDQAKKLDEAFASGDAAQKLAATNAVARALIKSAD
ncbi:hypothetical protein [Oceanibium sediminis]|uniref:hypothetical protein n=1 Tax=Oceanibium sediminis TaxID=2026339 RepID=UPI000DD3BD27|nr:hypothetical protein [Oceanibium sediminis]